MTANNNPLEFEKQLVELELELDKLKTKIAAGDLTKQDEYSKLENKLNKLRQDVYSKLTAYQRVQLSRHFDRPFTLDLIKFIFTDFVELHGDRLFRDDPAIVSGTAELDGIPIAIIGHQRGRTTADRIKRNFGMPQPEGYRKALRIFRLAEKFGLPIITFIDTQGAFPGLEAEERGQAEAIARNLAELAEVTVPVISVVIGEGGSGGALALGVSDKILMLENACYSVITPEGCASILWPKEPVAEKAPVAAEMLQLTAKSLLKFGIIDEIISEPVGGAHYNHKETAENLKISLEKHLRELAKLKVGELVENRYKKFRAMGEFI